MKTAEEWVRELELLPHPEGGFYREVYRSDEMVAGEGLPGRYGAGRCLGTSIYYLLRRGEVSRLHRLKSDEIWYWHAGGGAVVHVIREDGRYGARRIGEGGVPQVIIPRGCWFGATVEAGEYVLVGCAVFPGFEFADFEIGKREEMVRRYPGLRGVIERLCGE